MSQSKASSFSSSKRPRPSPSVVPAYIPPAALTPRQNCLNERLSGFPADIEIGAMNSSIQTSPLRVQYIPIIDLAAGPFTDLQDTTLDTDITAFNASPPLPPIASQPFIPARDLAWRAHLMHLQAWHALTVRITASDLRASHRIIIRELAAAQVDELQHLRAAHDRDLLESQNRFAELFGRMLEEKNAEIEREGRERDGVIGRLRGQLDGLNGDMAHMHQLNLAQARALGEERLKARKQAQVQKEMQRKVQRASEDSFAHDDTDANHPSSPTFSIHHPNNAKRAKDLRSQRPTWSTLENLSLPAGGLPIRKARRELGLPTPRATFETVRMIGGIDWLPDGVVRSMSMSAGGEGEGERKGMRFAPLEGGMGGEVGSVGPYRRRNGSVTRSGRRIEGREQTQGPRSSRTLRDVESEMMLRPLPYDGERRGIVVGLELGRSRSRSRSRGSYRAAPAENKGEDGESERESRQDGEEFDTEAGKEAERDNTPAGEERQVQESIDRIGSPETKAAIGAESARWGPGPSVLNLARQAAGNGGPKTS